MKLRDDWQFRGLVHQTTDDAVLDRLSSGGVTAYIGFDPTARSLHLGHLMQLCTLRRLQEPAIAPSCWPAGAPG